MGPDLSRLVNLKTLFLNGQGAVEYKISESISCLQKLEVFHIDETPIRELPLGLASLVNLANFHMNWCKGVRFPPNLQVIDLACSFTLFWS